MNVLILGSGGREHALAWKISQSNKLSKLFIAPGNAGTADLGTNLNLSPEDFPGVKKVILDRDIEMVIVGPEAPLVAGISNFISGDFDLKHISIIGPSKEGAQLEGSKDFAKQFMVKYNIPTARFQTFNSETLEEGKKYLTRLNPPYVLKADGLAAGKGVLILDSLEEAQVELEKMIGGKFGKASSNVVVEEFLKGVELSVFVLTDGNGYVILPEAKDYKRIGEGDTGLNTGGMGAISPVPFADSSFMNKVEERIIKPTIKGIQKEKLNYKGFIFFGLINIEGDPYVIEYNVRMGDPEAEVVIPRIKTDLLDLFLATHENRLSETVIETDQLTVATVMLVSGGYPEKYEKGFRISGLGSVHESILFHAGTKIENESIITSGGRVISVSSYGSSMDEALLKSYKSADDVKFEGKYLRKDIGFDL